MVPAASTIPNAVNTFGVSNPQPDRNHPSDLAANVHRLKDADSENTLTGRIGSLYKFGDAVTANVTYFYQRQEVGGRTINNALAFDTGRYESGQRVPEPNTRKNQLLSLELSADLGFATLTSASVFSHYTENGQRDQTDLLLSFEYGYEEFPSFTASTRETGREDRLSQDIRLVSNSTGPFSWIGGLFYNLDKSTFKSSEFVPGYPQYAGIDRPDNLEYYSATDPTFAESAAFGELSYKITRAWQVRGGGRYFGYHNKINNGTALPLVDGSAPSEIAPVFTSNSISSSSGIFKFNTSYQFNKRFLGYATISQGYRNRGLNTVTPCQNPIPPGQNVCALPNEILIKPDKTLNHEIGLKTSWFGGRLTVNGDVYYIDWKDVQVAGVTQNGSVPITVNGARAASQGLEFAVLGKIDRHWSIAANYSYNDARLSKDAPGIVGGSLGSTDAKEGDRLPGSPINQGSLRLSYSDRLANGWKVEAGYGINALDGVLTKVGGDNYGERLSGFTIHKADVVLSGGPWRARLYVNNLFDKYAETGVRSDLAGVQPIQGPVGPNNFIERRYFKNVLPPRIFGLQFDYDFDL